MKQGDFMPIKIRKTLLKEPFIFDTIGNHWEQDAITRPQGFPLYHYLQSEKGTGKLEIEGKKYILNEGEGFLIAPNIPHSYEPEGEEWLTTFITFTGMVEDTISKILGDRQIIFTSKEQGTVIATLIDDMMERYENPSIDAKSFSVDTYRILMNFVDNISTYKNDPLYKKYVEPIITEIEQGYNYEITLQSLSKKIYISPQYLSRLFKRFVGCSVYKYLTNYRINKAKELLLTDQRTEIQQIAQLVGFLDTSHFIVMFKKFVGITPLEYRKLN